MAILGVDVGGTFTDAVLVEEGRIRTAKVPTAKRQEESVLAAARAVGRRPSSSASPTGQPSRRTRSSSGAAPKRRTSATQASSICSICAARRARTCIACARSIRSLSCRSIAATASAAGWAGGELEPLDLDSLPDVGDAEAVAVCLLFAFRDPSHEQAVAAELRRRHPGVHVVASHELAPEFREYERASTTAADAYLAPIAARYLRGLAAAAIEAGLPEPVVMLSSGGSPRRRKQRRTRRRLLVSGPAAGVVGAGLLARRAGFADAVAFDMGGTSTDVCLLPGGRAERCPSA